MKHIVTGITVVVSLAAGVPGEAKEAEPTLSCSEPTTVVVPLVKADARWPKEPWRFACFPQQVEVSVVSLQSSADSSRWTLVIPTLRASVMDEGPLRLALTGICSGSSGKAAILEGSLKWGSVGIGLRNCKMSEYQALRLQFRVEQ